VAVLQHKRELSSLAREWHTFPNGASADERRALETEERLASDAAQEWREHSGRELESIIETLREIFPELPSWASTDPEFAHSAAAEHVKSEIERLAATLAVEDANANREGELDQEIERFDARLKIIDDQVLGLSDTASGLSRALAEIVPHIHSDDCPVCGQDFSKTGKGSLMQHVQAKIASLTEQAGRLAALGTERSQTQTLRSERAREKAQVAASRLSSADRLALQARMASLAAPAQSLAAIAKQVATGADILRRQTRAQRRLAELRDRDRRASEVRATLSALCATLEQPGLGRSESIEAGFSRIEGHLTDKQNHWTRERDIRLGALSACEDLIKAENDAAESKRQANEGGEAFITIERAYQVVERRRQQARRVADVARDVRTSIVRRVFNESLNTLWRDLFIRLAPTEPYVPAFSLPQTAEGVVAQLETRHRSGAQGGTPGSMLSAGNLNTAALTLFLSLHLSVEPKFPWLVLDDPVQSMDEVHISQFAALLRKISKDHGRKVLIATHDRQLFNYLALELSPAFPNDQLITVELSRSATDVTIATPRFWPYQRDEVIAA
jgi:exonuclease SbcC